MTRSRESAHYMRGRPLPRSLCDVHLLALCIWPCRNPLVCNRSTGLPNVLFACGKHTAISLREVSQADGADRGRGLVISRCWTRRGRGAQLLAARTGLRDA
jgi:hypothetical protein